MTFILLHQWFINQNSSCWSNIKVRRKQSKCFSILHEKINEGPKYKEQKEILANINRLENAQNSVD